MNVFKLVFLNASRRKRIAAGSGTTVQDVNKLVKQYQDMARLMKKMGTKSGAAAMKAMLGGGAGGLGGGAMPTAEQMQQCRSRWANLETLLEIYKAVKMPGGLNPFGGGGGLPGLGGFPGRKK